MFKCIYLSIYHELSETWTMYICGLEEKGGYKMLLILNDWSYYVLKCIQWIMIMYNEWHNENYN